MLFPRQKVREEWKCLPSPSYYAHQIKLYEMKGYMACGEWREIYIIFFDELV